MESQLKLGLQSCNKIVSDVNVTATANLYFVWFTNFSAVERLSKMRITWSIAVDKPTSIQTLLNTLSHFSKFLEMYDSRTIVREGRTRTRVQRKWGAWILQKILKAQKDRSKKTNGAAKKARKHLTILQSSFLYQLYCHWLLFPS